MAIAADFAIGCIGQGVHRWFEHGNIGIAMRAHDTGVVGARTEGFVNGKIATTSVPLFPELISQRPPNCLTLSRMPCMPTPTFNPDEELTGAGRPLPSSWISTRTSRSSRVMRMLAVRLPE